MASGFILVLVPESAADRELRTRREAREAALAKARAAGLTDEDLAALA